MQLALTADAFNKSNIPMPVLADNDAGVQTQTKKLWDSDEDMDDRISCAVCYQMSSRSMNHAAAIPKDNNACHAYAIPILQAHRSGSLRCTSVFLKPNAALLGPS